MEDGFFAPVEFEQLAQLDYWTPDGRRIDSRGFGTRNLPRPIYLMDQQAGGGHMGARIAGRLDEVTVNMDGVVSGKGLLLDDEVGRKASRYLATRTIRDNSVDLADIEHEFVEYTPAGETETRLGLNFKKANIGATTLVGIGAMPDATATGGALFTVSGEEIPDIRKGELIHAGSFSGSSSITVTSPFAAPTYVTDVPLSVFEGKESRKGAYPLTVEADGTVHGYLTDWKTRHLTNAGHMYAPKGRGYQYFNASEVMTGEGRIATGPLVIGGDHAPGGLSWTKTKDFYASTSFAWADVHATDDRHGIRLNGIVRPGTPNEAVHAGRASRLSGDWRRVNGHMELVASLSCNAPAFPVGRQFTSEVEGSFVLFAPTHFDVDESAADALTKINEAELSAIRDRILLNRVRLLSA